MNQLQRWRRMLMILAALAFGALGCNLTALLPGAGGVVTPTSPLSVPNVVINSPPNGSEVVIGQEVLVQSTAQDSIGVTRVELRVNSFIVNTVSAQSSNGERLFSVIQSWIPNEAGVANLEVIAYRGLIASAPARITLLVRQNAAQITATLPPPSGVTLPPPEDRTCRARVEVSGLNFRTGPGTNYPILRVLEAGTLVDIIGRLGDNSWWQVRSGLEIGWLSATYTSESGDCSLIPVAVPPPSPTPRPATATPTATFTPSPIPGSPTPTSSPTPSIPDLVVSTITGPEVLQLNATGTVGARYTVRVYNQGTGSSGQFTTSFRQPDGSVIQLPIVVNLAPAQYADLGVDVLFTASNTYRLEAFVDSGAQVAESDEGNNIRTLNVVVTTLPGLLITLPGGGLALTPVGP
ncbi:MAG: SH3 domain-containing protein [Anaerolineae bacterium]|nr:SH3 domain-containing protein [Anaerolineae bacterium]